MPKNKENVGQILDQYRAESEAQQLEIERLKDQLEIERLKDQLEIERLKDQLACARVAIRKAIKYLEQEDYQIS